MMYKQTTQVPNILFDKLLPTLTEAELKLLLVIIRQTYGWVDQRTGRRKTRDRISHSQFQLKTGLCKRVITKALQTLVTKGLITISCQNGNLLHTTLERKGISKLFYAFQPVHIVTPTSAQKLPRPVHESAMYKTNYTKLNKTKEKERSSMRSIAEIIAGMARVKN